MLGWIHISRSSSPSIRFEELMVVVPLDFSKGHKLEGEQEIKKIKKIKKIRTNIEKKGIGMNCF